MASHGLHPALDLRLVGWLAPDSLQAAAERFPRNGSVDLHQGIVFGVQSGVAILDIEKAHLSHVALLRPCWLTCFSDSKPRGRWVLLEMPYGNTGVRQCDMANWLFGQAGCCTSPGSSRCNRPCQVSDVSRVYSNWGIRSRHQNFQVPYPTLRSEIDSNMPVEVAYQWNGGGGHVAVVMGWQSGNFLKVNDPWYGRRGVRYSSLQSAYGQGSWFATWIGIQ